MKAKTINTGSEDVTIIASGVVLEGKISSNGNVRIDGTVRGNIRADGNVTVGEGGEVEGEIFATLVTVGGKIIGSVSANEKIVLGTKASVKGDLNTKILEVESGAKFDGKSSMSGEQPPTLRSINKENENEE